MNGSGGGDEALRRSLQAAVGAQYEIIRLLGRGGMGAVYLARDRLERLVAIKVILPHAFGVTGARERFRQEMRTVARFAHPNIVPIYSSGELDELDYFVMMYVSGDSVAARLQQDGRMEPEEVRRILVETADALHYAHGLGVIHRDVKPANVMIDDLTGRAYLTDFGVAKTLSTARSESLDTMAGTIGYIPPEAYNFGKVDHRADIYALGVLGYEMIAGRRPFTGDTPIQMIVQTVSGAPAELGSLVPDVPPDLASVVMSCLAKDPGDRPRDARRLRNAFNLRESDETTMPADLANMAGFGSWTLLWIAVWGTFAVRAVDRLPLGIALFVIALIVPAGFVLQVMGMRPARLPVMQIARVAFWPAKWWGMWWPRKLRRPTDLWPWLPIRARAARISLSAFLIVVPALILLTTENDWISAQSGVLPLLSAIIGIFAVGVIAVLADGWLWARRESLDARETLRMLIGPTVVSPLWDSPSVSRLLTMSRSSAPVDHRKQPANPRACVEAIRRIEHELAGASRPSGTLAIQTACEWCRQIEALDLEILKLTDHSNEDGLQAEQLERDLNELTKNPHADANGSRRRELLSRLEQMRGATNGVAILRHERERLFDSQCEIWRELSRLALLDPEDRAAGKLRHRILRLCNGAGPPDETESEGDSTFVKPSPIAPAPAGSPARISPDGARP